MNLVCKAAQVCGVNTGAFQKMVKGQWVATWDRCWNHTERNCTWMIKASILVSLRKKEVKSKKWHISLMKDNSFTEGGISSYDSEYRSIKKKFNYMPTTIQLKDKNEKLKKCLTLTADEGISCLYTQVSVYRTGNKQWGWRQFQWKEICLALKHKCHTSFTFREIQVKPSTSSYVSLIRSAKLKLDTVQPHWNTESTDRNNLLK